MIISKATGSWGEGANDASFDLEVVGNTPQEVEHFRTLADEPTHVHTSFENGALKITLSFERRIPLKEQAKQKADAEAKGEAERQAAVKKAADEAKAKADAAQKQLHDEIVKRSAQILADKLTPKA